VEAWSGERMGGELLGTLPLGVGHSEEAMAVRGKGSKTGLKVP